MLNVFKSKETIALSPSFVIFTTFFLLGLYFLYYIRSIIILLFLGFIVMVALNPGVSFLNRRFKIPRVVGSLLMYLLVIGSFVLLAALIVPPLMNQMYQLVRSVDVPFLQQELVNYGFQPPEISNLVGRVGDTVNVAINVITGTFSRIFTFFTLLVISFYLMLDRPNLYKKAMWFTRDAKQIADFRAFIDSLESQLGGWVRAQLVLMLVIGLLTFAFLTALGIPYAIPLAIMAAALEIIPNIGPTIAAVPAVILAYLYFGPAWAVMTMLSYIVVQQLENHVIVPKIMKDNVDVNPLVAIVTILIGLEIGGVIGAILSIPTYIIFRTIYSIWFRNKVREPLSTSG